MAFTTDLGKILNKLTPDAPLSTGEEFGVEEKVLLWTNSSPSSSFAAQTISLDLDGYNEVLIEYKQHATDWDNINTTIAPINNAGFLFYNHWVNGVRSIEVNETSATFQNAYSYLNYNNDTQTITNVLLVPTKIYGIKKVGGGYNLHLLFINRYLRRKIF